MARAGRSRQATAWHGGIQYSGNTTGLVETELAHACAQSRRRDSPSSIEAAPELEASCSRAFRPGRDIAKRKKFDVGNKRNTVERDAPHPTVDLIGVGDHRARGKGCAVRAAGHVVVISNTFR